MAASAMKLPPGFVLEEPEAPATLPAAAAPALAPEMKLPEGFVLEEAPNETPGIVPEFAPVLQAPPAVPGAAPAAAAGVQRLAEATASSIIPTSVEGAKNLMTPRAGQAGFTGFAEEEAARVESAVKGVREHPALKNNIPGKIYEVGADILAPMLRPSAWQEALGGEALFMGAGKVSAAVRAGLAPGAESVAINMARRALGYSKRFFKKPEDFARANQVAQEMLKQRVISPSTKTMIERAEIISEKAGKEIGDVLDQLDAKGFNSVETTDIVNEVVNQLDPGKSGGVYDKTRKIVEEIVDTINAHGPEQRISFESAQELKSVLKGEAKFDKMTDKKRSLLYQRAYGILRGAIDKRVDEVGQFIGDKEKKIFSDYVNSKGVYGKSEEALGALTNKLGGELGNAIIGLRETIVAASELAAGNPVKAAMVAGSKPLTQGAAAMAAKVADSLARYLKKVPPNQRQSILKVLVDTGTLSIARKYYNEFSSRGVNLPKEPKSKNAEEIDKVKANQKYMDNPVQQFADVALDPKRMLEDQAKMLKEDPVGYGINFAGGMKLIKGAIKPNAWSGVVDLRDGAVESTWTKAEAADMDFHHSALIDATQDEGIQAGEKAYFWVDKKGEPQTMEKGTLSSELKRKIKEQFNTAVSDIKSSVSKTTKTKQVIKATSDELKGKLDPPTEFKRGTEFGHAYWLSKDGDLIDVNRYENHQHFIGAIKDEKLASRFGLTKEEVKTFKDLGTEPQPRAVNASNRILARKGNVRLTEDGTILYVNSRTFDPKIVDSLFEFVSKRKPETIVWETMSGADKELTLEQFLEMKQ